MKRLLSVSAVSLLPLILSAAPIPGLFSTGVDDEGVPLADNLVDPHYELVANAHDGGSDALAMGAIPSPPWVANSATSRWIGPTADSNGSPGLYTFRITFDLSGFDESTARISGSWSSDNGAPAMRLNDLDTGLSHPGNFDTLIDFELAGGFVPGVNTLEFDVVNAGDTPNPVGLRVDMVGTVDLPGEPPTILARPAGIQVFEGDPFDLSVLADGAAPLSYQWQRDGTDLAGATGDTYSVAAASATDSGNYTVVVSNPFGTATSDPPATVTIVQPIPGLFPTGVDEFGALLPDGETDPHYQIAVNAHEDSSDAVVQTTVGFPIGTGPWLASGPNSKWIGPTFDTNAAEGDYTFRTTIDLTGLDPATAFVRGRWSTDNSGIDILVNGTPTGNTNGGFGGYSDFTLNPGSFISGINTIDFRVNNLPASNNPVGFRVDEITGGAIPSEVQVELVILRQPEGMMIRVTESATLSVLADGTPPLSYQWRFNGVDLAGATGPELILPDFGEPEVGDYDVVVSNASGSVTSEVATLTILPQPPVIVTQPRSTIAARGDELTLSVVVEGLAPLTYQWRREGVDIPGAVGADLILSEVGPGEAGAYDVVITNSDGTVTSEAVTLTLLDRVTGLFNSGVDDDGNPLADNQVDPHYELIVSADPGFPGPDAVTLNPGFPVGPWWIEGPGSRWIVPQAAAGNGAPGLYTFRTTFDLLGFDPTTVVLFGNWSSDNGIPELRLNGVATGQGHGGDFTKLAEFEVTDGFVEGLNTLEFDVSNAGDTPNPIGLRVDNLNVFGLWVGLPRIEITNVRHDADADTTELTWKSSPGQFFEIRKSLHLAVDPEDWPVLMTQVPAAETPAGTTTRLVDVNAAEPEAFYKVFRLPPPPLFEDDFETDTGWTTGVNDGNENTVWERGAPGNVGPPAGASGSASCFGTNLTSNYAFDADAFLRSPPIDLTGDGLASARLSMQQFKDTEAGFDFGSIRVLRASDHVQLGADIVAVIDGLSADWEEFAANLPPEAIGQIIKLEFRFVSDNLVNQAGWYIDNVVVTGR